MGGHRLTLAIVVLLALACASVCLAYTQGDPEFRAIWVDAWGAGCRNADEVEKLLGVPGDPTKKGDIRNANCNAVIVQVRRRADTCYPSSMGEPYMTGLSPANFNGLQAVIDAAHDTTGGKQRIEVHAWIVTFATASGVTGPVYYAHDDPADVDNYWPTRDNSGNETSDKAFDPGHPKCEEYTVNVCMDIVNNFDIDALHYDYIRFTGANQGYNPTSIARYNARYGLTGQPAPDNDLFEQWRRDQITAVVRQVYARIQASKPWVKQTGSFVTWNPSATASTRAAFMDTRPYNQVYCDWDSWQQEGIMDAAVPMTYYNWASLPDDYTRWINFEKDRKFNRHMYIGPGIGSNSLANAIRELNMTRDPSPAGNYAHGFAGYSYGGPYCGGTWEGFSPTFVSDVANTPVTIPIMPWKANPTKGHISGTVTHIPGGAWADGATVAISGPVNRTMLCDGMGFYAFIDLTPGAYTVTASQGGSITQQRQVDVAIGDVTGNMYVTDFALVTAPVITNVRPTQILTNSATIAWDTDQASFSYVEWGLTTSYGSSKGLYSAYVTSHSVGLTGLAANTQYHYRVTSANSNGTRTSADYALTTGSYSLTLTPNPSAGGSCTGGGWHMAGTSVSASAVLNPGYFLVSWSTNADGTGVVSNANPYVFNMPSNAYSLYANLQTSVADIIIESRSGGLNLNWYSDAGLLDSSAKSSAAGCTPLIGSRYGTLDITSREAHYMPAIPVSGEYQVWVTWGSSSSGGTNIKHTVTHRDGQYTKTYNQSSGGNLYNKWNSIGTFPFLAGGTGECGELRQYVTATQSSKRIMADAAKWVYTGPFKATTPSPANGATDVPTTDTTLSWVAGGTTGSYDVSLGTSEGSMVKVSSAQTGTTYVPETLAPSTAYYWRVDSNCLGETTTGDVWSFTTAAVPPVISNVVVTNVAVSSATISWTTDLPATSQVHYGTSSSYGQSTTKDAALTTSHSVNLANLTDNTVYHFCAESVGATGLAGRSSDRTFMTPTAPLEIIVDNLQGSVTLGTWTPLTDSGGWPTTASQYVYAPNVNTSTTAKFTWTPNLPTTGHYNVYCWYKAATADRTTSARYTIVYAGGQTMVTPVNQTINGSQWYKIADSVQFDAGTSGYVQLGNKTGEADGTKKVVADAIRFEYAENDTTPPSVPTNLAAAAVSTSQINLTWSASIDNQVVVGYRVYRNSQIVGSTSSTSYSDTGLDANTQYTYTVTAYDAKSNESAQSAAMARFTFARPVLAAHVTCDRATNTWYNTHPFTFTNDGFGPSKLASYRFAFDHSPTRAWTDTEIQWTTTSTHALVASSAQGWYFHVKGYNGEGVGCGTLDMGPYKCDAEAPTVPTGLTATAVSTTGIDLSWTASTDNLGVTGYRVYRDSQLLTTTASTSYSDTGRTANTQYTYAVAACDAVSNESAQCGPVARFTFARPVSPADVACDKTAGIWYDTIHSTFTNDGFGPGKLATYRWVWDQSPTHSWTDTEDPWSTASLVLDCTSSVQGWYLHARGYNGDGVPCGTLDMGPYLYDWQEPTAPTNLTATAVSTSRIDLTWNESTDDVAVMGYNIYRDSNFLTATPCILYSDTGLTANTFHSYTVTAYDAAQNESSLSFPFPRYTLARPVSTEHVTCDRNTNTNYPTPAFTFTNDGFGPGKLSYYRYVWDNAASYTWTGEEPAWTTTQMTFNAASTSPWFLHLQGYNGDGVPCGKIAYGPYYYGIGYDRISDAMNNPDGTQVFFGLCKTITAVFGTYFYIEEPDRTRGIRVEASTTRSVGECVRLSGTLRGSTGERYLTDIQELSAAPGIAPRPLMLRANMLGGKAPNVYTSGIAGAPSPYNVGLLVRVAGTVASHTTGSFLLDDGSGKTVKVYSGKVVADGDTVGVTGVCCVESEAPVIQTRNPADVMIY